MTVDVIGSVSRLVGIVLLALDRDLEATVPAHEVSRAADLVRGTILVGAIGYAYQRQFLGYDGPFHEFTGLRVVLPSPGFGVDRVEFGKRRLAVVECIGRHDRTYIDPLPPRSVGWSDELPVRRVLQRNRVPESVNIETIRAYNPNFKRLGLLYNTNEDNSP
jgi:hypothetical protein